MCSGGKKLLFILLLFSLFIFQAFSRDTELRERELVNSILIQLPILKQQMTELEKELLASQASNLSLTMELQTVKAELIEVSLSSQKQANLIIALSIDSEKQTDQLITLNNDLTSYIAYNSKLKKTNEALIVGVIATPILASLVTGLIVYFNEN